MGERSQILSVRIQKRRSKVGGKNNLKLYINSQASDHSNLVYIARSLIQCCALHDKNEEGTKSKVLERTNLMSYISGH